MNNTQTSYNPGLSYAENIYYGSSISRPALTIVKTMDEHEPVKLRPAKRLNYAGGRHKLTPEQIETRDLIKAERRADRDNERLSERRRRLAAKEFLLAQKRERMIELLREKVEREQQQSSRNKKYRVGATPACPEPVEGLIIEGQMHASGVFKVCNTPHLEGCTSVQINAKTVIQVKHGHDIAAAIASYKNKHNLL